MNLDNLHNLVKLAVHYRTPLNLAANVFAKGVAAQDVGVVPHPRRRKIQAPKKNQVRENKTLGKMMKQGSVLAFELAFQPLQRSTQTNSRTL